MVNNETLRIAILHPDLGIGGAERLIVDAALELQQKGHTVDIFTSHHDPHHSFKETNDGSLNIFVIGDSLPTHIKGKMAIVCAMARNLAASITIIKNFGTNNSFGTPSPSNTRQTPLGTYELFLVDQLSVSIPVLRWCGSRILFYCHFPDQLLSTRTSLLKKIYRIPFDMIEEITTGESDRILVNSKFTAEIFNKTFKALVHRGIEPSVLYPSLLFDNYDDNIQYDQSEKIRLADAEEDNSNLREKSNPKVANDSTDSDIGTDMDTCPIQSVNRNIFTFVSINRFENKKNVITSILSFAKFKQYLQNNQDQENRESEGLEYNKDRITETKHCFKYTQTKYIIAGGYDPRVTENQENYQSLKKAALENNLKVSDVPDMSGDIVFLRSFNEQQRTSLIRRANAVVYTPPNEHFGIVPIEAMYGGRPVLAVNSGGPLESIEQGVTGFLCDGTSQGFYNIMMDIYRVYEYDNKRLETMKEACRVRVRTLFSIESFGNQLNQHAWDTVGGSLKIYKTLRTSRISENKEYMWSITLGLSFALSIFVIFFYFES